MNAGQLASRHRRVARAEWPVAPPGKIKSKDRCRSPSLSMASPSPLGSSTCTYTSLIFTPQGQTAAATALARSSSAGLWRTPISVCGKCPVHSGDVFSAVYQNCVVFMDELHFLRPCQAGLDLSFARSQGEYNCMWRCPRPSFNPSDLVNNSSLAAGPQFTEVKIL